MSEMVYTKSRTLRRGTDGLVIDESKEADSTTGQAAHRLTRGIHDKGHTFTRNLQSDGKVGTMQILHNLEKDDLAGFEQTWTNNARKSLPGWSEGYMQNDPIHAGHTHRSSKEGSCTK